MSTGADRGFFAAAQEVYAREAPEIFDGHHGDPPRPEELPDGGEEIERSGLFGPVVRRSYFW